MKWFGTCVVFGFCVGSTAFGKPAPAVCADLLQSSTLQMIFKQVKKLDPAILSGTLPAVSLSQNYLELKRAEESVRREGLSLAQVTHLRTAFAPQFALESADATTLGRFYLNGVHTLYVRLAKFWRVQETRAQMGSVASPELEAYGSRLIETYFMPFGLDDEDLSTAAAAEVMRTRPWLLFPWPAGIAFIQDWFVYQKAHPEVRDLDFARWASATYEARKLTWQQVTRLDRALVARHLGLICCGSDPGCVRCPHNRRWIFRLSPAGD